jgi:hypothetical protein
MNPSGFIYNYNANNMKKKYFRRSSTVIGHHGTNPSLDNS